jgi:hypothetical protein
MIPGLETLAHPISDYLIFEEVSEGNMCHLSNS